MSKLSTLLLTALLLASCSKNQSAAPVVAEIKSEKKPAPFHVIKPEDTLLATGSNSDDAVSTEVKLRRDALFNRTFLYGASLQFSSLNDPKYSVAMLGINIGQVPAIFQIVDDKLRFVTDATINFESDINHPAKLIHEFPILRQDRDTVTVRAEKASPMLVTALVDDPDDIVNGKYPALDHSWIRSMQFVPEQEIIMIESTLTWVNGSAAEFMETIVPRDRQVAATVKPIFNDDSVEPLAQRFRFLSNSEAFFTQPDGTRTKSKTASRFILQNNEPVKWWITKNVPAKFLPDVKNGLEGWNRYGQAMWKRDIIKFMGILPDGVKLGDPRYNTIVWDNVAEAGAAYESQNADPLSGVQSQSMIYLPLAWVNIGKDYWKLAGNAEDKGSAIMNQLTEFSKHTFAGRALPLNCIDGAHLHVNMSAKMDPETFGRELLKAVVFHEVGHSFGLAHNFKGSLLFDPDHLEKGFSTSIMDYNAYNEETAAFTSLDSADGPLLEYDRQIISVLYNEGKDIKATDAVLPACADAEADSKAGGVDPLCVRYDIGGDPTKQVQRILELTTNPNAKNGRFYSLSNALNNTLGDLGKAADVKTVDDAKAAVTKLLGSIKGVASVYLSGSANSFGYQASQIMRNLYVYRDGVLLEGYNENEMRDRTVSTLDLVSKFDTFPEAVNTQLGKIKEETSRWLLTTPAFANFSASDRDKNLAQILSNMDATNKKTESAVLSKMRTRIFGEIGYSSTAPLSFHDRGSEKLDLEAFVISILEKEHEAGTAGFRPFTERTAALKTLLSFKKTEAGSAALARVQSKLTEESRKSTDAKRREEVRKLIAQLAG